MHSILFFLGGFRYGGYEILTIKLANELSKSNFIVTIISLSTDKDTLDKVSENVHIHIIPRKRKLDFQTIKKIRDNLILIKPDIIFNGSYITYYYSMFSNLFLSKKPKFIFAFHLTVPTSKKNHLENLIFTFIQKFLRNDKYIAIHSSQIDFYESIYGIPKKKFALIYNGVDTELFRNPKKKYSKNHKLRIVHVASLKELKDQFTLLKAIVELNYKTENWFLEIAGRDNSEYAKRLKKFCISNGIKEKVTFLGQVSDVKKLLCKADLFILTSKTEALPVSIIEAMSMGLPVITTNVGGCPELVSEGKEGYLVNVEDYQTIAHRIIHLYQHPEIITQMSKNARKKVISNFTFTKMIDDYIQLFNRIK